MKNRQLFRPNEKIIAKSPLQKRVIIAASISLLFAVSVGHVAGQKAIDEAQEQVQKAQKGVDKAKEAYNKAQKEADDAKKAADEAQAAADKAPKSYADKKAEEAIKKAGEAEQKADEADKQAENDWEAAQKAKEDAAKSQAEVDKGTPGSAKQAAIDKKKAEEAEEKAAQSEKNADMADKQAGKAAEEAKKLSEKADKGKKADDPQKINREKQKEAREKAEAARKKKRELEKKRKQYEKKLKELFDLQKKLLGLGPRPSNGPSLAALAADGKVDLVGCSGTGQTIGHIADLKLRNRTNDRLRCRLPAMVLESLSKKNQDYVCPREQMIDLGPNETKTVPIDGICGNRGKPPVGKGVDGDLAMNTGDPTIPTPPGCKIPANHVNDLVRRCGKKYDAVDELLKGGPLKDFPYKDKEKQRDILIQWSTWTDPQICQMTGATPATKEDLKNVVYKQVEEKGPMTPETKKKVDEGIDQIFDKVELTSEKAKDLEEPEEDDGTQPTDQDSSINEIGDTLRDDTGGTQEKKKGGKGKGKGKKDKKFPPDIQNWWDKFKAARQADLDAQAKRNKYQRERQDFFEKNKHYRDVKEQRDKAQEKAGKPDATQQDKDNAKNAQGELDKLEKNLEKDFNETKDGKKALGEMNDAQKAADKANAAEQDAGKNIDPIVKDTIQENNKYDIPGVW